MTIRALVLPLLAGGMLTCAPIVSVRAQEPIAAASLAAPTVQPTSSEARLLTVDEVRQRLDAGEKIVFLDARGTVSGEIVKGALHVTADSVDGWAANVPKDTTIVAYCACPTDGGGKAVAARLSALGFGRAFALHGGIGAWKAAGLPTEIYATGSN